jgi:hypothetical protein
MVQDILFYYRPPRVVDRELNECKSYLKSIEKHSGAFEEICIAYCEKKTKYERITEDLSLLERELAVCRNVINNIIQAISFI